MAIRNWGGFMVEAWHSMIEGLLKLLFYERAIWPVIGELLATPSRTETRTIFQRAISCYRQYSLGRQNYKDWIRASDAMFARLGIKEDKKVKRSRMGTTIAFTPLFSVSEARERRARQQQVEPPDVTQHLEDSESNDKNLGKAGE